MALQESIVSLCEVINGYLLEDRHHPVKLEVRGQSLSLRAKLPSKESGGKPSMQRISLGVKGDKPGLKKAMRIAIQIQDQLKSDSFQWRVYDSNYHSKESIEKSLEQFKESFFNDPKRQTNLNATNATWRCAYAPYLNRLRDFQEKQNHPFNSELFLMVLEDYKPNTSSRLKCGTVLKRLADQENIILDKNWSKICNGYQSLKKGRLKYPTDEEIVELRNKIPNPKWRWMFSMLAVFGLRTHEVFFCDAEDFLSESNKHNAIRVGDETKTGERLVYPLRPDWVDQFELKDIQKPNVNTSLENPGRLMTYISNNVARKFREYSLGFIPYSLRHAWAVRSIHHGLNPSIAAKMMGHSVEMYTKTYHYYLSEKDMNKAYVDAIQT